MNNPDLDTHREKFNLVFVNIGEIPTPFIFKRNLWQSLPCMSRILAKHDPCCPLRYVCIQCGGAGCWAGCVFVRWYRLVSVLTVDGSSRAQCHRQCVCVQDVVAICWLDSYYASARSHMFAFTTLILNLLRNRIYLELLY